MLILTNNKEQEGVYIYKSNKEEDYSTMGVGMLFFSRNRTLAKECVYDTADKRMENRIRLGVQSSAWIKSKSRQRHQQQQNPYQRVVP